MKKTAKRAAKGAVTRKPLPANARLTGIALMCGATLFFTGIDTSAKYLNYYMDTVQVVWARYLGAFLVGFIFFNPLTEPGLMNTKRPWLQLVRSALLLFSTILNIFALRYLQLDETMSILFATPLLVAVFSIPFLGERIGPRRWAAIVVGFIGVLIITRPGLGHMHPAAFLTVAGTFCFALYNISTRILSTTDSSGTTLFYSNLFGAVVMSMAVPFVWTWPSGWFQIAIMVIMGACGAFGHYLLIARAPARAGIDPRAVHLYAADLGEHFGLSCVQRSAQSLDVDRCHHCDRIRSLSSVPRAQGAGRSRAGGDNGTAAIICLL